MTTKNLENNIADLPKWAQSEIKRLQMRLNESKAELNRIQENPVSNTIEGSSYSTRNEKTKYLMNNQRITFVLGKGEIQAYISDDYLEIYSIGGTDLFIRPKVSNIVQLHLK